MNEKIEVRFLKNGRRFRVKRQVSGGIEFEEREPLERSIGLGLQPRGEATRTRMDNIRRLQGWLPGQFQLNMAVEDGSLVLRGANPHALPEGLYKLQLQIEESKVTGGWRNVSVDHNSTGAIDVDVNLDDRSVAVDLSGSGQEIHDVLGRSEIDGSEGVDWVQDDSHRPTRQACLLNLLATLRTRPGKSDPLLGLVHHVFAVANDRIYARVDRAFLETLETLADDETKPFFEEGEPHAPIHQRLFALMDEPPAVIAQFGGLRSFRSEAKSGTPSMQAVVAVAPPALPYTYAEFDLDLGNPLQDVLGFFVHLGELLDGKATNHLDLWKPLHRTAAGPFLGYRVLA